MEKKDVVEYECPFSPFAMCEMKEDCMKCDVYQSYINYVPISQKGEKVMPINRFFEGRGMLDVISDELINILVAQKIFKQKVCRDLGSTFSIQFIDKTKVDLPDYCIGDHIESLFAKLALDNYKMVIAIDKGEVKMAAEKGKASSSATMLKPTHVDKDVGLCYIRTLCETALVASGLSNTKQHDVYVE